MSIRVGFSTDNGFVAKVIRWATGGTVSHCFVMYYDEDWKRDMVLEAGWNSFRLVPFTRIEKDVTATFVPMHSIEQGLRTAVDYLGDMYDYPGLLGMAWVELGRIIKRGWLNPWQHKRALFCSESVAQIMLDSAYPGFNLLPSTTDPQQLLEFFLEEGAARRAAECEEGRHGV